MLPPPRAQNAAENTPADGNRKEDVSDKDGEGVRSAQNHNANIKRSEDMAASDEPAYVKALEKGPII